MSSQDLLSKHRKAIDVIDAHILELLSQRAQHARTIGEIKGTGAVYRPEREAQVLSRIRALNQGPLPDESVARLFREIMSECLAIERPLTITHLGPEGTFTQQAARKHFGHAAKTIACATVDESLRMVEARQADYAVAPVENSTEGSVGRTLDLLVSTPLQVCGEVQLRIHHHLLSKNNDLGKIKTVYAHAQALAQCQHWLRKHLPANVALTAVSSNAEAARLASIHAETAAIAGQSAAEVYGLIKLADNIEDEPNNTTRFLVLGHEHVPPSGQDKTSLIIGAPNQSGMLNHMIEPFSHAGVSLTKFESRPSHAGLWEYIFFIDVEGHIRDANLQAALEKVRERAAFMKIIGSYPLAVL